MIVRKHIFICYDAHDRNIASDMYEIFKTTLDDEVWIRFHNLHGGNIVASLLAEAVNEEKWVLLLISKNALENDAISSDIQQSTIRWLEGMNCRFIIVKVDNSPWPRHLKHILETTSYRIDISANEDEEDEFLRLAVYIDSQDSLTTSKTVFIDRGDTLDRIQYSAKYKPLIFILGLAGIGKTSLVLNRVGQQLRKQPLHVSFGKGKGEAIDYLLRQILLKANVRQPLDSEEMTINELMNLGVQTLKQREKWLFLFIDNLEYSLVEGNNLSQMFLGFLDQLLDADFQSNIFIASTRKPFYPPRISRVSEVIKLDTLDDIYIRQCFDEWLIDHPKRDEYLKSEFLDDLVKFADGFPLVHSQDECDG